MKMAVTVCIYITFDENEICNPDELIEFRKYLDFHKIGYSVYEHPASLRSKPDETLIRQIQVFCPANYEHNDVLAIANEAEKLKLPYIMPDFVYIKKPKEDYLPEVTQPETKSYSERLRIQKKNANIQQTPLSFFQDEQPNRQIQSKDAERRKPTKKQQKGAE